VLQVFGVCEDPSHGAGGVRVSLGSAGGEGGVQAQDAGVRRRGVCAEFLGEGISV